MTDRATRQLLRYVVEAFGDDFRGIVRHRGDAVTAVYTRDGLDTRPFKRRITRTFARAACECRDEGDATPFPAEDHVELFDGIVVLYVTGGPRTGTIVSLDSPFAADLLTFAENCRTARTAERDPEVVA